MNIAYIKSMDCEHFFKEMLTTHSLSKQCAKNVTDVIINIEIIFFFIITAPFRFLCTDTIAYIVITFQSSFMKLLSVVFCHETSVN